VLGSLPVAVFVHKEVVAADAISAAFIFVTAAKPDGGVIVLTPSIAAKR
jgi:hypothetical protein